ncbi:MULTISPECIES: hypothetical protein [unclassified Nitratiruptor]|uniref:hypothetical protein n=1 Tax=unclassified Nitratiruptor TaxID=2624044 RepID=UPI0019156787|nr:MULTISPECIES: hypothetical protein [unclassified Nitratiruptor]BCD60318.1 hydrogenase maturation protein HypF [Nitratiruptor sp. YY08-10]BCD64193.1 hydrogenase maturation protein HypF [Nitratiruptor sp. YY08-14]
MTLRFEYHSHTTYFLKRIQSIADATATPIAYSIVFPNIFVDFNENVDEFTKALDQYLYNSIFFKNIQIYEESPSSQGSIAHIPSSIALCPNCIKEMLDPSSRRFYYPFTSCNSCGYQSSLLIHYPFERPNTLLNFFKPCNECQEELKTNPFRKNYPLITCIECNIPIKLTDKKGLKVLFANEKEEFKQIFDIAANALKDGKRVRIKTFRGYKRFYLEKDNKSYLLINRLNEEFLVLPMEKRALFSIERPQMYLTTSSGEIVEAVGVWDGFTTLFMASLDADYCYFDEKEDADLFIDFDLPITFYGAPKYFINKHFSFFRPNSESLFPKYCNSSKTALIGSFLLHNGIIDKVEHFKEVETDSITVFQEEPIEHSSIRVQNLARAVFESVLKEHGITEPTVGVYFSDTVKFFYKKQTIKEIFDFGEIKFEAKRKVVEQFQKRFPERYEAFEKENDFILKAARVIGFDGDFDSFNKLSLSFGGKGGVSIDCRVEESSFDYSSFYASIMSFVLADADSKLIAYSIFESLGDFLSNQAVSIYRETKASHIVLCGAYIANSAFFSRFTRNAPMTKVNIEYPIDNESALLGV